MINLLLISVLLVLIHVATAFATPLKIPFIKNIGQLPQNISYYATTFSENAVYIMKNGEIVYSLPNGKFLIERFGNLPSSVICEPSSTRVSYFVGKDPRKWYRNIPTFKSITLKNTYPGVNLTLVAYDKKIEKIFTVLPGSSPNVISIEFKGTNKLKLDSKGNLCISKDVYFSKPIAYQILRGKRREIAISYRLISKNRYGFKVGNYNTNLPLYIDPVLTVRYLGGSKGDNTWTESFVLKTSSSGIYIAGYTISTGLPASDERPYNPLGRRYGFIAKLGPDLKSIEKSIYVGGSGDDRIRDLLITSSGEIYVTGDTNSVDFPNAVNHISQNFDAFVAKISPDLGGVEKSIYIGGYVDDIAYGIALSPSGDIYIAGESCSQNLPNASNHLHGVNYDGFVAEIDADLSQIKKSIFVGGTGSDSALDITIDSHGNIYITGGTNSNDFPNSINEYKGGEADVFIANLNLDLTEINKTIYIGGSGEDIARSIEISHDGNIYIAGRTSSHDFQGALNEYFGGDMDSFIAEISPDLSEVEKALYIGGSDYDEAHLLYQDESSQRILIGGETGSQDFEKTVNSYSGKGDGFIAIIAPDLSKIEKSLYFGGSDYDEVNGILAMADGTILISGTTSSSDIPKSLNSFQCGENKAFIATISSDLSEIRSSFYFGGYGWDEIYALKPSPSGEIYVAGKTDSLEFSSVAENALHNMEDAFIAKLSSDLKEVKAMIYIGGNSHDYALALSFSPSGDIYIAGHTTSNDLPNATGEFKGYSKGFVARVSPDLDDVKKTIYIGGSAYDDVISMDISNDGFIYVTGYTYSRDLPNASNELFGTQDAFVAKIPPDLSEIERSIYVGGSEADIGTDLKISSKGDIYICGQTLSNDLYKASNSNHGFWDAFVAKISSDLAEIKGTIYVGGSSIDSSLSIQIAENGNIYIAGTTYSEDLSGSLNEKSGEGDAFVAQLDDNLTKVEKSLYIGGEKNDIGTKLSVLPDGIYICGYSSSERIPGFVNENSGEIDSFLAKIDDTLNGIEMGSFFGGKNSDIARALYVKSDDDITVAGYTFSTDLPEAVNSNSGGEDAFVARISLEGGRKSGGGCSATRKPQKNLLFPIIYIFPLLLILLRCLDKRKIV
ncbi:MAG: SBBP repeat-containing protein [Synergistetes bacterium]|nr:SBBP repeat-containing protein [Synergistota bacterium]